jgi:hypothetical protein
MPRRHRETRRKSCRRLFPPCYRHVSVSPWWIFVTFILVHTSLSAAGARPGGQPILWWKRQMALATPENCLHARLVPGRQERWRARADLPPVVPMGGRKAGVDGRRRAKGLGGLPMAA